MKDLKAIRGTYYIATLVAQGEHEHQDFKFAISDARKIARSLSAFANNDGGRLLIGVKDNGVVAGVRNEEDIYVVQAAAQSFCVPPQPLRVAAFACEGGARVVRVEIDPSPRRPVMVREADGLRAYFRVADENIAVPPLVMRAWRECAHAAVVGPTHRAVLAALAQGPLPPDDVARRSHLSLATASDTLVDLHAMGLAGFTHTPHGWEVGLKEKDNHHE